MQHNIHSDYFKWWCGTVIIGAIPIFIRFIAYFITNKNIELINITELICFGFAIQISSIYYGMGQPSKQTENNIIINTTISIVFIVLFSIIYIIAMLADNILNMNTTRILVAITCGISLYIGQNSVRCAIINNKVVAQE